MGLFCEKWTIKIRHPLGLRHPVCDMAFWLCLMTHSYEKWLTHMRNDSRILEMTHSYEKWLTHMRNDSRIWDLTFVSDLTFIWDMSHVIWVMSHMSHVTHESCHIWVMSHMSHVTYESCHIWVTSRMSHVTHESWHIWVVPMLRCTCVTRRIHMHNMTKESYTHEWVTSYATHTKESSDTHE